MCYCDFFPLILQCFTVIYFAFIFLHFSRYFIIIYLFIFNLTLLFFLFFQDTLFILLTSQKGGKASGNSGDSGNNLWEEVQLTRVVTETGSTPCSTIPCSCLGSVGDAKTF